MKKVIVYYGFRTAYYTLYFWPLLVIPPIVEWLSGWEWTRTWLGGSIFIGLISWLLWVFGMPPLLNQLMPEPRKGPLGT